MINKSVISPKWLWLFVIMMSAAVQLMNAQCSTSYFSCDPRCKRDPGNSNRGYCQYDGSTSNLQCLSACGCVSTYPSLGNIYQWYSTTTLTRCDTYCPPNYYPVTAGQLCQDCHAWCLTCFGANQFQCNSCTTSSYQLNSTACYLYQLVGITDRAYNPCITGYYGLQIQKVCIACPTGCASCSLFLREEMPGNFAAGAGNYFKDNYNQNNVNCTGDPLCKYALKCYTCKSGFTLIDGFCLSNTQCFTYSFTTSTGGTFNPANCNCYPGFQLLGLSICTKCSISCVTCLPTDTAYCQTCPSGHLDVASGVCSYNTTYESIESWTSTPSLSTTTNANGFFKTVDGPTDTSILIGTCSTANYVFGYYGYNLFGQSYYSASVTAGQSHFPSTAALKYNKASVTQAHYGIRIRATLLFIDQWLDGLSIIVSQNSFNRFSFTYQMQEAAGQYLCGLNYYDHHDIMDDWFPHTASSISNLVIKAATPGYAWGIKEIRMLIMKCHASCASCDGPTIDDCITCPTNQILVEGICKCDSPNGYFNLTGTCVNNCGTRYENPYIYECVTSCTWPYAFGYIDATDSNALKCVVSCPVAYYKKYNVDGLTGTCETTCFSAAITNPALNSYQFDGNDRICNITCPSGTNGNPYNGTCVRTCPAYTTSTNDGYFSYNQFCYEICPLTTLFAYIPQRACLTTCPSGYYKNYKQKASATYKPNGANASICQQQCSITLGGLFLYGDNATGYCTNWCASGTYGDISIFKCVAVCNISAFGQMIITAGVQVRTCVIDCSIVNNLYGNPQSGFCVSPANCPTNFYAEDSTFQCKRYCSVTLQYGDNVTKKCSVNRCTNTTTTAFKHNDTKICVKTCVNNNTWLEPEYGDPVSGYCVRACYGAYYADAQFNMQCVLICSSTPSPTFGENNMCVINCSSTTWADQYNPSRTCTTSCRNDASFKSYGFNKTRACILYCPDGQFADISTGIPLCKYGCPINPVSSSTGLFGNVVNNICQTVCPSPYFGDQTGNRTCLLRCPWPYYAQDCTQNVNVFTYSIYRQCQLGCACGWADNSSQLCVWNSTGCANLTFAHQTNHKCVVSIQCTGFADPVTRYCIPTCLWNSSVIYFAYAGTAERTCVLVCPEVPNLFGDNTTQSCSTSCTGTQVRDFQNNRRCVTLTNCSTTSLFLYGDHLKDQCVVALNCSDGYYADNVTHRCIDICPGPILLYADNITKQCVRICELGYYALNVTVGQGICSVKCPQDLWADNITVQCTSRCSSNSYGVNYTASSWTTFSVTFSSYGICQAECRVNEFARDSDNLCVPNCGAGKWGDRLSRKCQISPFDCPSGYYADDTLNECVVPLSCSIVGGVQYVADNTTKKCVIKCPANTAIFTNYADMVKFLCVARCPNNYYGFNTTLRCQLTCKFADNTYEGSYADAQLSICVSICTGYPISTYGQNNTYTCVKPADCPADTWAEDSVYDRRCYGPCPKANVRDGNVQMFGDNITKTCVTGCPTYSFADLSLGYGLCLFICPNLLNGTRQFADNSTKTCVTICPAGNLTFGSNLTRSCVYTCPIGSYAQELPDRYCVERCSPGTWGQDIKRTCVHSPLYCPTVNNSKYYADNTKAMCVLVCPDVNSVNSTQDYWGQNTTRLCLPNCLTTSGAQSGFKWNLTRVCIDTCPPQLGIRGYFSDQGMCYDVCITANYYRDPQYLRSCQSNCTFTPLKQYQDDTTWRCVLQCPTYPQQYYSYDPTKTCVLTCPNSYRKYQALKSCVQTCPTGTFFNSDTFQCKSICPVSTTTNLQTYGDLTLAEPACVINTNCPLTYYADDNLGLCVNNCSQNQWIHVKNCVAICPDGFYGHPTNRSCVIPANCPSNYYADKETITCVLVCSGTFADSSTKTCVQKCPIIGGVKYFADSTTRICQTTCTTSSSIILIQNTIDQTCVSSCATGLFLQFVNNECLGHCLNASYADNSTKRCVTICPSTPSLFGQNGTYTCVQTCLVATQYKFIAGRVCVTTCPSTLYRDNTTRTCVSDCLNTTFADDTNKYCVTDCRPQYAYDLTNKCMADCPEPYFNDPITFKCVTACPTSPEQHFLDTRSANRICTTTCETNQFKDYSTYSCVTSCSPSPITYADTTTSSCLSVCSNNFYAYEQDRTCVGTCPSGMFADPLTRYCVAKCDPLLDYFGDKNTVPPKCVKTCTLNSYTDPFTQTCVSSCPTFPKMYSFDDGDVSNPKRECLYTCPYPYTADNSTSKCLLYCNSTSFPFRDQATQRCTPICTSPVYQYSYMPNTQLVNGQCVKFCPDGTFALLTNNSCVSRCPDGLYGSTQNNTCNANCSLANNEYADPYNNLCMTTCTSSATYFSYADDYTRKCVLVCPTQKGTYGDKLIWKCVKRCSSLTQYIDFSAKICVTQCPTSFFSDNVTQTCVSSCWINTLSYGDTSSLTCVPQCLLTTLFADDVTRLCVVASSCSNGFFGYNDTRKCIQVCPTTPNLYGDPLSRTCILECQFSPVKYFAVDHTRICVTHCPSVPSLFAYTPSKKCVASCLGGTFADNATRLCTSSCTNTPIKSYADNSTYQCVTTCPTLPNYFASNITWECVWLCPSVPEMYSDNSTRLCVEYCPKGIINTFADDSTRKCVDKCPGVTYNQNSTQKCVTDCLTGYSDPKSKFCIAICPPYTYGDNKTKSCVTGCPIYNNRQTYAEDNLNMCMYDCLSVYKTFKDDFTFRCVPFCPLSNSTFADVSTRSCVATCPPLPNDTYADSSTRYCVRTCPQVPALFAISLSNRVCTAVCPNTTWSDNNTRTCLSLCITTPQTFGDNSTWTCVTKCPSKPYTFADNISHTCLPRCPSTPDYYGDNVTQTCVLYCPVNTFADPVSRRCVTTCPWTYFAQNSTARCVQSCPWRQFANNLTNICVAKCSVDPIYYGNPDNLLCVPVCPLTNHSFGNPLTQQCVKYLTTGFSGCPSTYFSDNTSRLCVQVCPMYDDTYGDNSTWKCVAVCPAGLANTFSDNSTMRCVEVCPTYPQFYSQTYSRRCVHYCLKANGTFSGTFSDNSTRNCTDRCPSTPDYYSDNSTGRCVFYCPQHPQTFADYSTRRCVSICPESPDIYGDNKTLRCVLQCPRDQQTFSDNTTRMCVKTCPSSPPFYAENISLRCVTGCPNSSYADNLTRKCVAVCPRYPQTYSDPSTNKCVDTCPISPDLFADSISQMCVSRCPNQSYAENDTRRCLKQCLFNKTNYADDYTNRCVAKCPESQATYGENTTKKCVLQCPLVPFTYADNVTRNCLNICLNLTTGGYANNVTRVCVARCPVNSYGDITTRYCVRYCPPGWYAYDFSNMCVSYCPTPYFGDNTTWTCVGRCSGKQRMFGLPIDNICVHFCPNGTYASQDKQECVTRCPNSSQTVLGIDTFGYNDTSDVLDHNYCVNQCPLPLYGYPVAQVCVDICPDPYYQNITDHRCYKCPIECASCNYPQLCLTCVADHFLYSGACVQTCPTFPVITYANPNRVCSSAQNCTQGFYALNATKSCVQTCPAGTFVNIVAQICQNCMRGCISCMSSSSCLTCNTLISVWSNFKCYMFCSRNRKFFGTIGCVQACPAGTYLNLTTCQSCSDSCKTCIISSTNCLVCSKGFYVSSGICVATCPSGTIAKLVNGSQTCISCSVTSCAVQPLTFTTTQFVDNFKFNIQIKFNQKVNITEQINKVIQLQQITRGRLLQTTFQYLDYTIIDNGDGLYNFILNNYDPSSNSYVQVQIINPSAIMGQSGQLPSNTRSQLLIDSSNFYSLENYNKMIDGFLYAVAIYSFILLLFTFGTEHSIWMPIYDFMQIIMLFIFININYPPNLLYSVQKLFASAFTFLPNMFKTSFSKAFFDIKYINNNIFSIMVDSSFLRVMGPLYFILIILGSVLLTIFVLSKKAPSKGIKKWAKSFIRQTFWKKHLYGLIQLFSLPVFAFTFFNMRLYSYFTKSTIQGFSIFSSYLFTILFIVAFVFWTYKLRKFTKEHSLVYLMIQKAYNFIAYQKTVLVENKDHYFSHDKNQVDLTYARQPRINEVLIFPYPIETRSGPWQISQPLLNFLYKLLTAVFLAMAFENVVIQLILLILLNIVFIVYYMLRKPFFTVKTRQYNNEIYIHNLVLISIIEVILLIFAFTQVQMQQSSKIVIANVICAFIIEGAVVNVIYFTFRSYNYYHHHIWKAFIRSDFFKLNYTVEHLQWVKSYQDQEKRLRSEVKPRGQFLEAIAVQTEDALGNIGYAGKALSISTNTKQKIKALQLRPNKTSMVARQYGQLFMSLGNQKQKSHKSIASSDRLSKGQRKKIRDVIFGEKQLKKTKEENYERLNIIEEKSQGDIAIMGNVSHDEENEETEYEFEYIEEEYPEGTPMEEMLKDCKKGNLIMP